MATASWPHKDDKPEGFPRWVQGVLAVAMILSLILLLIGVGRYMVSREPASIQSEVVGFEQISKDEVSLRVSIQRKDPATPARCVAVLLDKSKDEVGRSDITVAGGSDDAPWYLAMVPVSGLPYSAKVESCEALTVGSA